MNDNETKSGKKGIIIGAIIALVVIVVAVLALALGGGSTNLIGTGLKNSIKALQKNQTISLISNVANGGSTEIIADLETLTVSVTGEPVLDGSVSVKLHTDFENSKAAAVGSLNLDNSEPLDASIFFSQDSIAVASKWLLGKEAYGVDLTKLAENFEKSEFGEDGEYSLDIEIPEDAANYAADAKKFAEDTQKLAEDVLAKLAKTVNKNAEITKQSDSIDFGDETVKTTAVTVSMDHEQIAAVCADMIDYVRTDKGIKHYLDENIRYILVVSGEVSVDVAEDELKDYIDQFYDELDEIDEDSMEMLAEQFEESDVSIDLTFHITKRGQQLVGIESKVTADDETIRASIYAGPDLANITEIDIRTTSVYDETYRISYVVETNDKNEYEAELKITEDSEPLTSGSISWDKKNGDFTATISDEWGDEYTFEGTLESSAKKASLFIERVASDYGTVDFDTTVVLTASDNVPSTPKFKDVLKMDADELEELGEDISEVIEEFYQMLSDY